MKKQIEITLKQQDELINISMEAFRNQDCTDLRQSIREEHKWWIKNFLPNAKIERVDRIQPLVYEITYQNYYPQTSNSIFDGRTNYSEMYE